LYTLIYFTEAIRAYWRNFILENFESSSWRLLTRVHRWIFQQ